MDETWHQRVRRVYPGENAAAFVRKGGLSNDLEVLSPAQFGPQLTHLNCEAANRLGNFLSMLGAAIETAQGLLQMQHNEPEKSGMEQLRAVFDEDNGTLLHAAQLLNLSNKREASPQELQNAILQVVHLHVQRRLGEALAAVGEVLLAFIQLRDCSLYKATRS